MYKHSTKRKRGRKLKRGTNFFIFKEDFPNLCCDENLSRGKKQSVKAVRLEDNGTEVTEVLKTQEVGRLCWCRFNLSDFADAGLACEDVAANNALMNVA